MMLLNCKTVMIKLGIFTSPFTTLKTCKPERVRQVEKYSNASMRRVLQTMRRAQMTYSLCMAHACQRQTLARKYVQYALAKYTTIQHFRLASLNKSASAVRSPWNIRLEVLH